MQEATESELISQANFFKLTLQGDWIPPQAPRKWNS